MSLARFGLERFTQSLTTSSSQDLFTFCPYHIVFFTDTLIYFTVNICAYFKLHTYYLRANQQLDNTRCTDSVLGPSCIWMKTSNDSMRHTIGWISLDPRFRVLRVSLAFSPRPVGKSIRPEVSSSTLITAYRAKEFPITVTKQSGPLMTKDGGGKSLFPKLISIFHLKLDTDKGQLN